MKCALAVEIEPLLGASMTYERAALNCRHYFLQNSSMVDGNGVKVQLPNRTHF